MKADIGSIHVAVVVVYTHFFGVIDIHHELKIIFRIIAQYLVQSLKRSQTSATKVETDYKDSFQTYHPNLGRPFDRFFDTSDSFSSRKAMQL